MSRSKYRSIPVLFAAFACLTGSHIAQGTESSDVVGRTDPNRGLFPDSSIISFRHLLDAPAGKHGFLQVRNGKFAWPNGKRARFWGVNISSKSVWVDRPTIDRVVDVLARSGCNMVRFEALDSFGGLTEIEGSNTSRRLDPWKLEILDYWTHRLKQRGIYYYLNLIDFRTFKEGDEVPTWDQLGRAAKPYAFFDRRLIDLQKEFAQQLLTRQNPLTGKSYAQDPALALVEICNEHGLFMKADMLDRLAEPYGTGFRQMWNQWLVKRHGNREGIKRAWGSLQGEPVLGDSEDPGLYSVKLPLFSSVPGYLRADSSNGTVLDVRRATTRLRDGVRFLYETQRSYFREMRGFLRSIGVKVPVTGVVSNDIIPDVASAAAELDFTSENYYGDHPVFSGTDWQGKYFHNNTNPLRASTVYQFAPWLAALRWENKPVVVREFATVWPNRYRAVGIPEAAAYASFQDFDAVLLFGYRLAPDPELIGDFDHQADPPVWGLFAYGGQAFLRGDIAVSPQTVTIDYTSETLFRWPNQIGDLHRVSWAARLNSRTFGTMESTGLAHRSAGASGKETLVPRSSTLSQILQRLQLESNLKVGVLKSSTAQIERRTGDGILKVVTPRTVALAGDLPINRPVGVGPLSLTTATAIGAIMAVSLDGLPLAKSKRFVIKMVSEARNTGQRLERSPAGPARYYVKAQGTTPIVTNGEPSSKPTIITLDGRRILSLGLVNGVWEVSVKPATATLSCDTPGIRGTLFGRSILTDGVHSITVSAR